MLCQFSFQNYKCFKKEALLDFIAEPIDKEDKSVISDKIDGEKFLPIIAIYGPNGGGKSTVLEALGYLRSRILHKIILSRAIQGDNQDEAIMMKILADTNIKEKYHKFDPACKNIPTAFDILFRTQGNEYRYTLSLLGDVIVEENLYSRPVGEKNASIIFERSQNNSRVGDCLERVSLEKVNNTMPYLSHISINYDIPMVANAVTWFSNIKIFDYDNPLRETRLVFPSTESTHRMFFDMLGMMDINIHDVRLEKDVAGNIIDAYTKHRLEDGSSFELPFEEESSGTRKLFSCLAEILRCLHNGNLVIADELDAKLHPKLLKFIIGLFTNPKSNTGGAQLLITSHDIITMIPSVFRRDEIWFCALNPDNASKLYSLIALRKHNGKPPRNDEIYGRRYFSGLYGADPYIKQFADWGETNEP